MTVILLTAVPVCALVSIDFELWPGNLSIDETVAEGLSQAKSTTRLPKLRKLASHFLLYISKVDGP